MLLAQSQRRYRVRQACIAWENPCVMGIPVARGFSGKRGAPLTLESEARRRVIARFYWEEPQHSYRVREVCIAAENSRVTGIYSTTRAVSSVSALNPARREGPRKRPRFVHTSSALENTRRYSQGSSNTAPSSKAMDRRRDLLCRLTSVGWCLVGWSVIGIRRSLGTHAINGYGAAATARTGSGLNGRTQAPRPGRNQTSPAPPKGSKKRRGPDGGLGMATRIPYSNKAR